jgi:hypothetical protein
MKGDALFLRRYFMESVTLDSINKKETYFSVKKIVSFYHMKIKSSGNYERFIYNNSPTLSTLLLYLHIGVIYVTP